MSDNSAAPGAAEARLGAFPRGRSRIPPAPPAPFLPLESLPGRGAPRAGPRLAAPRRPGPPPLLRAAHLSSLCQPWSPSSRSRKRYRGGSGGTSLSKSTILPGGGGPTRGAPIAPGRRSAPPGTERRGTAAVPDRGRPSPDARGGRRAPHAPRGRYRPPG